ncbi:unnamed protein product [Cyprideis torosa]|uniref:Uncharacterized protein n=1 Tax=Cyprideis torosa TaxID=163714 RepID=A0A7R8WC68_9CRUS|nr:unnamed protein product [Cyprideis torosa]CAG0891644.1 unnamed protein product [Cyprideis torosa]
MRNRVSGDLRCLSRINLFVATSSLRIIISIHLTYLWRRYIQGPPAPLPGEAEVVQDEPPPDPVINVGPPPPLPGEGSRVGEEPPPVPVTTVPRCTTSSAVSVAQSSTSSAFTVAGSTMRPAASVEESARKRHKPSK